MKLVDSRIYGGRLFRPTPEVYNEEIGNLLVIATPWGPRSLAEKAVNRIKDHVLSTRNDAEVTSPFENLSCLSPLANNLRVAIMLANDVIFSEDNGNEYSGGVELFVAAREGSEIAIASIGQPWVLHDKPGFNLSLLSGSNDLSLYSSDGKTLSPPIPGELLGINSSSNFAIRQMRLDENDKLVLLSRTQVPPEIFSLARNERNLDHMSSLLSQSDEESPYWLGIVA